MKSSTALWLLLITLVVAVGSFTGWWTYQRSGSVSENSKLMSAGLTFSATTLSGEKIRLEDFAGRVVLVNFWASWCGPCLQEFPGMIRRLDEFPEKMVMIAFAADSAKDDVTGFLRSFDGHRPNFKIVWDPENVVSSRFRVRALPETFVFGPDQKLLFQVSGARDWSLPNALEGAAEFLGR
ncbi:MAG: TlpA family protein disulfide reductase [Bdellovibrionales bacterium]|nr:TlpA family protein disulfide reductase [Bdellovibrionales bacterium]